jgi:YaiO family outer membrane protein
MLLSLLLTGLLTAQAGATSRPPVVTTAAAIELAQNGEYEEALAAFRLIAARDSRDLEPRLWIGRLHIWMGHPERAEPVLRSVMLQDPSNVDVKLALGTALVGLERYDEAVTVLEQADEQAGDDPAVLAALGRAHRLAGNGTQSLVYAERAFTMAPTVDNRLLLEASRRAHDHRVEITSFVEDFSAGADVSDTNSTDVLANVRMTDRVRLVGRGQYQRKFGISDQRGGLGLEWRWMPRTTLFVQGLVGPGNQVLPRADANVELGHMRRNTDWTFGVRHIDFDGGAVSVVSPGVNWWASDRLSLALRYSLGITDVDNEDTSQDGHSLTVRGSYLVYPRVWLNLGYTRGVDNFDIVSGDQLGDFPANTATGGVRIDLPSLTSIVGQYQYQSRPGDIQMNRVTFALVQRF